MESVSEASWHKRVGDWPMDALVYDVRAGTCDAVGNLACIFVLNLQICVGHLGLVGQVIGVCFHHGCKCPLLACTKRGKACQQ